MTRIYIKQLIHILEEKLGVKIKVQFAMKVMISIIYPNVKMEEPIENQKINTTY
jgi:hypothetical protein